MPAYDSYLLRVWRSRRCEGWEWVLRLEHLQDGQRQQFEDPAALVEALWEARGARPTRPEGGQEAVAPPDPGTRSASCVFAGSQLNSVALR